MTYAELTDKELLLLGRALTSHICKCIAKGSRRKHGGWFEEHENTATLRQSIKAEWHRRMDAELAEAKANCTHPECNTCSR